MTHHDKEKVSGQHLASVSSIRPAGFAQSWCPQNEPIIKETKRIVH